MRLRSVTFVALAATAACAHRPPADFAPDPGLVARIREIRISAPASACPGASFGATYTAVLDDGSYIPFATTYDKNHPPRLHIVFLERHSDTATPLEGGGWSLDVDPLMSALDGFHLTATLLAKPSVTATAAVAPDYSCLPHAFGFQGDFGREGPDVTVRLGIVRSPFYPRLIVAGIQVGQAPPFYTLADANAVPPADWIIVESKGGRGTRGTRGSAGTAGGPGQNGCPPSDGGNGGDGGPGGAGGAGGPGGHVTVIVPAGDPFLAGLVDARTPGGEGGPGGAGGEPGKAGKGGAGGTDARTGQPCPSGRDGLAGRLGTAGPNGAPGQPGARPQILTVPLRDVFQAPLPPVLQQLLDGRRGPPGPP